MPDVWRVRGAPAFAALARPREHDGFRRRSGPVTVSWVPLRTRRSGAPARTTLREEDSRDSRDSGESGLVDAPAVAFAVSRKVGPAVVRNRLRRQLRDELAALARRSLLRPGCYLVGLQPAAAALDGATLRAHLRAALRAGGATVVAT